MRLQHVRLIIYLKSKALPAPHPNTRDGAIVVVSKKAHRREALLPHFVQPLEHSYSTAKKNVQKPNNLNSTTKDFLEVKEEHLSQ